MTEYQTHAALVATLETEIVRLRAVNAELRASIQAPIQPDTKLVEAARQALEVLSELAEWESEGDPRHPASVAITALREALEAAPRPTALEQKPVAHDEDLLEQLYWEFDHQRKKTGDERLAFKGKMRFYAREVFKKAHGIGGEV